MSLRPAGVLGGLLAASFAVRVALVFQRELQRYLPDEYLYGQLARSIAQGHGSRVLGEQVALPTLLQPLLTAPFWLNGNPELAFRLTQCANAAAMSLAAVVVYVLARELHAPEWSSVAAAALALASPDLLYAGYVTADAFGYLLALLAILAALRALSRPSLPLQLSFLGVAGLATFARAQYASLFVAVAVAAVVVERGRLRAIATRHALLVATPLLAATAVAATNRLGRYGTLTTFDANLGALSWLPASTFIVALAAGAVVVPGAIAWTARELVHPRDHVAAAFAAVAVCQVAVLLVAASLMATGTGSERFFERYLVIVPPLVAVAFCCWITSGRPARHLALGVAAVLVIAVARVPLSQFAAGQGRADSPVLLAVAQLESIVGVANASLLTALGATACMALAGLAAYGRIGGKELVGVTVAILALLSFGAHAADRSMSHAVRVSKLGPVANWVDRAERPDVLLVQTPGGDQSAAMLLTLQNSSVTGAALVGPRTAAFDGAVRRLTVQPAGQLRLDGRQVRRPLVLVETATRVAMSDAHVVRREGDFTLVAPAHAATVATIVEGMYQDGWLAASGALTVYATGTATLCRRATIRLTLPAGIPTTRLQWRQEGNTRLLTISARHGATVVLQGHRRIAHASFESPDARFATAPLSRLVSVRAHVDTVTRPCSSA